MSQPKVALITGGAKRVGRAIAERLSQAGFSVVFTYLTSQAEAESLAKQINGVAIKADLSDPSAAIDAISAAFSKSFDRLDVLVNSASIYEPATLSKTDLNLSRRLMAVHYESPLLLCKQFEPQLRQAGGHVVNMLDVLAERPWPQYMAYCASKAALWNLTQSLARELAPQVTVNGIAPGVVDWPAGYPQELKDKYLARVPLARAGTPTDVAETVHFLVTAGSYITGQIIRLDGGRSIV